MIGDVSNVVVGKSRMTSIGGAVGPMHVCGVELSNQVLLRVAAFSFLLFVVAEIVGALASNSLSLLGDAAAMSVDVFTYFCNMYSEHVKAKYGEVGPTTRMVLEVGIPLFSVTCLIAVSAWITHDAIMIILDPSDSGSVNVIFLFGFAAGNALIDIICTALFYIRRDDVLKAPLKAPPHNDVKSSGDLQKIMLENQHMHDSATSGADTNLNMASALTHVGGDTLRTGAVFIAAMVASLTDLDSTLCDAWAAVVVTVTILFLVGPLLNEIWKAYGRLSSDSSLP